MPSMLIEVLTFLIATEPTFCQSGWICCETMRCVEELCWVQHFKMEGVREDEG